MALIDDVIIRIKAGDGGAGGRAFASYHGSTKKHPDGGDGGNGGNIYFQGTTNLSDLGEFRFRKEITAENGANGMNKSLDGKNGKDITILVPLGTSIIDTKTQKTIEILDEKMPVLVAKGGLGGRGNYSLPNLTFKFRDAFKQKKGEEKELHLILNLIADIGLIGFPNAGKSSLLKTLTAALPKIGNYPFTTLEPNLGTLDKIVLADIPGLVEGASIGRGLGIQFLKHVQKTKILLHCIDASQYNPLDSYKTVRSELENYNPKLVEKKEIILLTKIDLIDEKTLKDHILKLKKTKKEILTSSIYNPESIDTLKEVLKKLI